jgi:hypothetical protein
MEDQDQHRNKRQKMDSEDACKEDKMDTDESPSPTNHDRQNSQHARQPVHDVDSSERSSERSIPKDELKESNQASDDVSLESLQKDMGDAFLLCKSSKTLIPSVC